MSQETRFPSIKRKTDPLENEDENSGGEMEAWSRKSHRYEEFGLFLRPIATQQSRWHHGAVSRKNEVFKSKRISVPKALIIVYKYIMIGLVSDTHLPYL